MEPFPIPRSNACEGRHWRTKSCNDSIDLYNASQRECGYTFQMLIEKGVDINARDSDNLTPYLRACHDGHIYAAQFLAERGADINALVDNQYTPFYMVCMKGYKDFAQMLADKGADINARGPDNLTPFHIACKNGHEDIVQMLAERGADINALCNHHWTPTSYHFACYYGHKGVVEILAKHGINFDVKNYYGMSPLHLAALFDYFSICKLLISLGVDLMAIDNNNKTALDMYGKRGWDSSYRSLSTETKEERCATLRGYLRSENMRRRMPFMIVLAENNYRPLQHFRLTDVAHGNTAMPIKDIPIDTKEQKHQFLLIQIFGNDDLMRHVASFL